MQVHSCSSVNGSTSSPETLTSIQYQRKYMLRLAVIMNLSYKLTAHSCRGGLACWRFFSSDSSPNSGHF